MDVQFQSGLRPNGLDRGVGPTSVSADAYRDPDRYEREVRHVLSASWILAGHGSAVANPNDVLLWDGFGQSVVIARDAEGELAAFHNVCQHRGVRLVEAGGPCPEGRLVCPWHGFTYDLAGTVSSIPRRASFAHDQVAGLRAPAVAVAEFAGLVWINLAGDPPESLVTSLAELADEFAAYGMDEWYLVGQRSWPIEANWKAVVEGFSEDYHARLVHDGTIPSGLDYAGTQITLFDRNSMMVTPLSATDYTQLAPPVDHRRHAYCHYSVFPTSIFSCFPTHTQVMSMVPMGVDRTELRAMIIANRQAPSGMDQDKYERRMATGVDHFAAIASEDVAILSRLAATRTSLGYRQNIFGALEARLSRFHQVIESSLADQPTT
jgi:phenylpropionate dioxygenase-like ring-hydroxylating dioxygenase large terminal subunit